MKNKAAVELGKSGGLKKSEEKTAACRKNASKPRARWVTAINYEVRTATIQADFEHAREGLMLVKGKELGDLAEDYEKNIEAIEDELNSRFREARIIEVLRFSSISRKI